MLVLVDIVISMTDGILFKCFKTTSPVANPQRSCQQMSAAPYGQLKECYTNNTTHENIYTSRPSALASVGYIQNKRCRKGQQFALFGFCLLSSIFLHVLQWGRRTKVIRRNASYTTLNTALTILQGTRRKHFFLRNIR